MTLRAPLAMLAVLVCSAVFPAQYASGDEPGKTSAEPKTLKPIAFLFSNMAWSPDGKFLALSVRKYFDQDGKVLEPTPENMRSSSARAKTAVQLWDVRRGRIEKEFGGGDNSYLIVLGFSPDWPSPIPASP